MENLFLKFNYIISEIIYLKIRSKYFDFEILEILYKSDIIHL